VETRFDALPDGGFRDHASSRKNERTAGSRLHYIPPPKGRGPV